MTIRFTLLALVASLLPLSAAPNIVLIVADDMGYGDPGCYGNKPSPTPHLDKLAKGGILFTDYHSAGSMCSPTRASMLTGLYPQRFGTQFDGALGKNMPGQVGLPLEAVTLSERMQEADYATACFGKWHLGYSAPLTPNRQGFDEFRGLLSGDGDFHTRIDRSGEPDWWHNETPVQESGYTTDLLTHHAVDFIEKHRENPFFLYLPHLAIHFPWQGPNDPPHRVAGTDYKKEKFGIVPDPSNVEPHVTAMLRSFDDSIGSVMEALEANDLLEDTLVIVTSDNGGYIDYPPKFENISSNGVYRGQKTEVYEGGHRVPLVVSWPGRIEPRVSNALVHSNDWLPTLLALAELAPVETDGLDLTPYLLEGIDIEERTLFWRTRNARALRKGPWKLCLIGKRSELYHLENDPAESKNLASDHPKWVAELTRELDDWNQEMIASSETLTKP